MKDGEARTEVSTGYKWCLMGDSKILKWHYFRQQKMPRRGVADSHQGIHSGMGRFFYFTVAFFLFDF